MYFKMKIRRPSAIRRCDEVAGGWGLFPEEPQREPQRRLAHEVVGLSLSKMDISSVKFRIGRVLT